MHTLISPCADFRMYRNTPPAPAAGAEGGTAESAPAAEPEAAADNGRKAADQAPPSFHKEEPCSGASPEEDEQHKEPIGAGAAAVGAKGGAEGSPAPQEADARAAALHPAAGGTLRDEPGSKRAGEPAAQELADTTAAAAADERQEADGTASVVVKQEAAAAALKQDGAALGGKPAPAAASAALPFPAAPGIRPGTSLPFAMPPAMAQMAQAQMAQMAQAAAMGQPAAAAAVRAMAAQAAAMAGASGPAQAQWALQWQVMQAHLQAQMQAAAAAQAAATAQAAPLPQSDSEDDAWAERQARLERLQDYRVPPDPEPGPVKWELVASSLEEFEVRAGLAGRVQGVGCRPLGHDGSGCWGRPPALRDLAPSYLVIQLARHIKLSWPHVSFPAGPCQPLCGERAPRRGGPCHHPASVCESPAPAPSSTRWFAQPDMFGQTTH